MAVSQFWAEIEKSGTPLVEPISGDERHSLVTFLWRAETETHNVAVVGAINGAEPAKNRMLHLANSDLWYISTKSATTPDSPMRSRQTIACCRSWISRAPR